MRLVESVGDQATIKADLAYEQPYRFKLWLAVVEDLSSLGMGSRAYLSHVRSSLQLWERAGTVFLNAKGAPLNLDALRADDLWGFLGKRSEEPQGPKRNIDSSKVAILDVYIKKKYPTLAATFGSSSISPEVAAVIRSFFEKGLASETYADPVDYVAPWSGIYVSTSQVNAQSIIRSRRLGEIPHLVVRAVMLRPTKRPQFCVAHKAIIPLRPEYMRQEAGMKAEWNKVSALIEHHKPKEKVIYNGIALLSRMSKTHADINISLMLRDRTTYQPCLSQFVIHRYDDVGEDNFDDTVRSVILGRELVNEDYSIPYKYCISDNFRIKSDIYTDKLFDDLDKLYFSLGEEV